MLGLLLALLAIVVLAPVYAPRYTMVLLISVFMYVALTVSWVLFSGPTGYVSLAPAAFFGIGIYTSAVLGRELPLLVLVVVGGLVSFGVAFLVGLLTLRLRGIYFAIFTFGLVELIKHVLLWYEVAITGTRGRFVIVVSNTTIYYIMLGIVVVVLLAAYFIRRSRFGLALRSIGENEEAAAHMGINVNILKTVTFAISAFFIGAVGTIMATRWTYIDPYIAFNYHFSFLPVLMAVFGGMGQLVGPVLGAVIFSYLEEVLITEFPYWYMLIMGSILVVAMLYLPNGVVGLVQGLWSRRWRKRRADT